ncbi:hypothetical protein ACPXCG_22705 [Gordonia sp. DT218]|uniref:hypothetical protein n=1 Tax=Gordonia sp. DT218 TaxID=3416659 RepID=UPI003CF84FB3
MNGEGCWSTVVCTPAERAALGLTGQSEWLLHCRLAAGHQGNHATDASVRPRADRRLWLEWNDFDDHAQSLIERNPCSVRSPQGAACLYFASHGGQHFFAPSNGHAPTEIRGPHPATGQTPTQGPGQSGEIPRPMPRPGPPGPRTPAPPAHPGQAPHQPDRMRMTTDTHIPVVRTAAQQSATQGSATQESSSQDAARTGGRPASRPAAPVPGAHANAGGRHDGYRPGRRSTDAEPPTPSAPRPGSRHRLPDADSGTPQSPQSPAGPPPKPTPPASPPPASPPPASPPPQAEQPERKPHATSQPTASSATSAHGAATQAASPTPAPGRGDADLAAALSEVAAALENLAAAVRASRNE